MTLPDFETVFKGQTYRLRGITSWDHVPSLGMENIERLRQLARESVLAGMAEGDSQNDLRRIKTAIDYLTECLFNSPSKPLFPRLRVESFRKGERVRIYLGDSEGTVAATEWVTAEITAVDKAFRSDWNDGSANGGYFWRWTATATDSVFSNQNQVRFSTSEPRVLPITEFEYLRRAGSDDPAFLSIFSENAWRTWEPLWCLERSSARCGAPIDMRAWLTKSVDQ